MKLSRYTFEILKNFSKIRRSILIPEGNYLITQKDDDGLFAFAKLPDEFPIECCIFDLNEFLGIISMFDIDKMELKFNESYVSITSEGSTIKYYLANKEILEDIKEQIIDENPSPDSPTFRFHLSNEKLKMIIKSASILNCDTVSITNKELRVFSENIPTSNDYSLSINGDGNGDDDFEACIAVENLLMLNGNYDVEVYEDGNCVKFSNSDVEELDYYILYKAG